MAKVSINDFRCPCCRARIPLETLVNDTVWGGIFSIYAKLERPIQGRVFHYLRLFETDSRPLLLAKAEEILESFLHLVEAGTVRRGHNEARPAPCQVWTEAMDRALAARPKDLKNHNYLRTIAFEVAQPLAARAEQENIDRARSVRNESSQGWGAGEQQAGPEQIGELVAALGKTVKPVGGPNCYTCPSFQEPTFCKRNYSQTKRLEQVRPVDGCEHHPKRKAVR